MKTLKKYSALCVVMSLYSCSLFGMLINKKCLNNLSIARKSYFWSTKKMNNHGLVTATIPQKANGALGEFRLDKQYGVRDYLANYIAFNKKITQEDALWEDFDAIEKASKQFLNHNSSTAIQIALNNNVINQEYAVEALYFTHKVVTQLQHHIEYNQHFAEQYENDAEQYIWVDKNAFKPNRRELLYGIEREKKEIIDLVDFLQQKPANKMYTIKSSGGVFEKEEVSHGWTFTLQLPAGKKRISPYRIAHTHDGVLGTFDPQKRYTIQEYLKRYRQECDDKVEWRALKTAYDDFLFFNMPSSIQHSFENSKNAKNIIYSSRPVVENVSQKEVKQALLFTRDVARAMRYYLRLDHCVSFTCQDFDDCTDDNCLCSGLYNQVAKLKDDDVTLFAQLGVEPAAIAQTWDGILGNFALSKKQNGKAQCTIQDYLCKYIARNLHIPEEAVATEATFIDIKKAFELFVGHNHPDAILRDFENELITKEHAKDALTFTFWVVNAFEKYLEDFQNDSHEMELFELFWQINRMREKSSGMRFVGQNEWSSVARE